MKSYINIVLCSICFYSCLNNNEKTKNNCRDKDFKILQQEKMLIPTDSLSSDGGLIYITSGDSLCNDSLIYSEFIVSVLDKHYKNRIVYRVLDNKSNWANLEKSFKENPNKYYGNIVLQDIISIKQDETIKISSYSPFYKMPLKTIKARVYLEIMDLPLK